MFQTLILQHIRRPIFQTFVTFIHHSGASLVCEGLYIPVRCTGRSGARQTSVCRRESVIQDAMAQTTVMAVSISQAGVAE